MEQTTVTNAMLRPTEVPVVLAVGGGWEYDVMIPPGGQDPFPVCQPGYPGVQLSTDGAIGYMSRDTNPGRDMITQEVYVYDSPERAAASWASLTRKMQARCQGSFDLDGYVSRVSSGRIASPVGGEQGWYFANFLWRLRGTIDLLLGGVGMRRGRRDPQTLRAGEALDFWRVESFEPPHLLRLSAEMKLPGRAWLQFEVVEHTEGSEIRQTAIFDPLGLAGLLYWYSLYFVHGWIFGGMLRRIAETAEQSADRNGSESQLIKQS